MWGFRGKCYGVGILVVSFVYPVEFGVVEGTVKPVEEEVLWEEEEEELP